MKIQHIILGHSDHVLVVDGTRGPLQQNSTLPALHPAGVVAYRPAAYGLSAAVAGKVFLILDAADFERIEDTACEPAQAAFKEYIEITRTCTEVKLARYGALAEEVKP